MFMSPKTLHIVSSVVLSAVVAMTAAAGYWFSTEAAAEGAGSCPWAEQDHIFASDPAANDGLGSGAAIDGETAIVGASGDDSNRGAAYVFVRSGGTWSQQQKLTASDGAPEDQFGNSVAISGDTVIIGAFGDDSVKGAAYIFTRSGTTWSQQQKLTASDGVADNRFGWSVVVNGDTAIAGATLHDNVRGAAYVFTRSGTVWSQQQKLSASDASAFDG